MMHDQIDRMVRQANPVPDITALERGPVSVLDQQRTTEVQTQDRVEFDQEQRKPRRGLLAAIAAAAVVVTAIGALILSQRTGEPPVTDQPTTGRPANGWVAFSAPETGTDLHDIFIVRDGGSAHRIVGSDGDGLHQDCPSFSPDGSKLAYMESPNADGGPEVGDPARVVVAEFDGNADGRELLRLPSTWRGCATWSPDSTRLAFVNQNEGWQFETSSRWGLNIATLDGEVTPLFAEFGSHFHLAWSPDGSAVALTGWGDDLRPRVWLVPVDGSQPTVLMEQPEGNSFESLSWSPGGSKLAVLGDTPFRQGFIWILGIDGSNYSIPVSAPNQFDVVTWSPDGGRLAYIDRATPRLTLVNPDGTDSVQLPIERRGLGTEPVGGPVWSPDGLRLLVTAELDNGTATPDGSRPAIVSVSRDSGLPATIERQGGGLDLYQVSWQPVFPPPSTISTPTSSIADNDWRAIFHSTRYGFSMGVPSGWTLVGADHDWTLAGDADNPMSTGQEMLLSPTESVRVSAWTVPLDDATTINELADIEAWVEHYCQQANNASCADAIDQAVPLCLEYWDCHPTGLLVPFNDNVQAFITGTDITAGPPGWPTAEEMTVVVVWRPETDPTVTQFGGAQRLLEVFMSTMDIWTPDREQRCERQEGETYAERVCVLDPGES